MSDKSAYPELRSFEAYPKTPRWFRDISISEKIDGTNGCVLVDFVPGKKQPTYGGSYARVEGKLKDVEGSYYVRAASRNRLVLPGKQDNFGFASYVFANAEAMTLLGPGRHYGEWYGEGIGRGYGMIGRAFALFNPTVVVPDCAELVPQLYTGPAIMADKQCAVTFWMRRLSYAGSEAVRGFKNPEGIIVFHSASNSCFKATFENDAAGKGG